MGVWDTCLFHGLWTDPVTGIAYARARWYDPRNAAFLTEDPLLDVDSPNLYAFVAWQPHMETDPLGLAYGDWWDPRSYAEAEFFTAEARQRSIQAVKHVYSNPYVQGSLQVVGGCGEAALGAMAVGTGVGTIPGVVAVVHGSDVCGTGVMTLITGDVQDTLTKRGVQTGLEAVGVSEGAAGTAAAYVDIGVSLFGSLGSARGLAGLGPVSARVAQQTTTAGAAGVKPAIPKTAGTASGRVGSMEQTWEKISRTVNRRYEWKNVRARVNRGPAPARPNQAFPRGVEKRELSHWIIPKRAQAPNWLKNSWWNRKKMWGTDHALADHQRYQFLPSGWKLAHPLPGPLTQFWNRSPTWAQVSFGAGAGIGVGFAIYELFFDEE